MPRHLATMMRVRCRPFLNASRLRFLGSSRGDDGEGDKPGPHYFHIAPSGDWWTGPSIFAAKHLQPDYVKSIKLPPDFDPELALGGDSDDQDDHAMKLLYKIYDDGELPAHLVEKGRKKE